MDLVPSVPEVRGHLKGLHDAGRAHRMHAAEQAAGQIGGQFSGLSGMGVGMVAVAGFDIIPTVSVGAYADVLIGLDITDGKGVMEFDQIEIVCRIGDPGHAVSVVGGHSRCEKTGKSRISVGAGKALAKVFILFGGLVGEKRDGHIQSVCWTQGMRTGGNIDA